MKDPRPVVRSQPAADILSELRVSGHLMRLDPGLFCIVQTPTPGADPASGLPGVRLSLPPGPAGRPDLVQITGFGPGGWLSGSGDAALVRVSGGGAQILVTIYQSLAAADGTAPNLQVMRLLDASGAVPPRAEAGPIGEAALAAGPEAALSGAGRAPRVMEVLAHIQERGDIGAMIGDWVGERGSKRWIEGFGIAPANGIATKDIEYQAVLGPGWLSPWVEGGQFCGSRAMALPVLGLRVRLRDEAAATHRVRYAATFVDGSQVGPVGDGEPCEAESLAAMESFHLELIATASPSRPVRKAAASKPAPAEGAASKPAPAAAPKPAPTPARPPRRKAAR